MKKVLASVAMMGSIAIAGMAEASLIAFDSFPGSWNGPVDNLIDSGFLISGNSQGYWIADGPNFCMPEGPGNGTHYLMTQNGDVPISVSSVSGHPFNLYSFQYAEQQINNYYAPYVTVTGHLLGGNTVRATFLLDGINDGSGPLADFQTGILPDSFHNLISVDFVAPNYLRYSLDNISVDATPTPIPAAVWLFASGLMGMIGLRRKKA
ncbi:MAG: hypothetical protein HXX11_10080 [Desulfuromonadales bacterium]|nr:hypothetical protein [Desulfuromonadales bacterium]